MFIWYLIDLHYCIFGQKCLCWWVLRCSPCVVEWGGEARFYYWNNKRFTRNLWFKQLNTYNISTVKASVGVLGWYIVQPCSNSWSAFTLWESDTYCPLFSWAGNTHRPLGITPSSGRVFIHRLRWSCSAVSPLHVYKELITALLLFMNTGPPPAFLIVLKHKDCFSVYFTSQNA